MKKICRALTFFITASLILSSVQTFAAQQKPYKNLVIPGIVAAVDFDNGDPGVAYSPLTGTRSGTYKYREGIELNFYNNEMGVVMGFNSGNWMKYTVNVSQDGIYNVVVRYSTPNDSATFELSSDDKAVIKSSLANTGGWTTQGEQPIGEVKLTKGTHMLQFKLLSGSITFKDVVFSKQGDEPKKIDFTKKTGSYRNVFIPSVIQAENYDLGAGSNYSVDGKNNGRQYRKEEPIDIFSTAKSEYYIKLSDGEYTKYTFNVEQSDAYSFKISAGSSGKANIYFDDNPQPVIVTLPAQVKEVDTEVVNIYLAEGAHSIIVKAIGSLQVDYFKFGTANGDYITEDSLKTIQEAPTIEQKEEKIYKTLYVSPNGDDNNDGSEEKPFRTIGRAKDEVATLRGDMDGDIIVNLLPGYYQLEKVEKFDEKSGGKNGFNVIFRGNNSLEAPIISGGTKVSGWQKTDTAIWKAPVSGVTDTRTLYINGLAAQRARSKYTYKPIDAYKEETSKYLEDGFNVSTINFPKHFEHPDKLEVVWEILWTCQRTPVRDIIYNNETASIVMEQPYYYLARTKQYEPTSPALDKPFYLENAKELLDEPGEFYYDSNEKMIYYYPFSKEDLLIADTYVGTTEFMFEVGGTDLNNKVSHLVFDNLDFRYGAWNEASTTGVIGMQADKLLLGENNSVGDGGRMLPAQFAVYNANNIQIKNCKFSSLGSGAISMANAVSDSKIEGNVFQDISGTAVIVGHWDHRNEMPAGMERCVNIDVANNVIRRAAQEFRGSCAISLYYVNAVNVHNNDIKEVPYSGISLGWGWGADIKDCANNTIAYNKIDDVTSSINDGAHIYTLGPMRNTSIIGNYLVNAGDYRGGIYLDQGSSYLTIKDNVIEKSEQWLFARAKAGLKDIYVANNFSDTDKMTQDKDNVTMEKNTILSNGNWSNEALAIISSAGVEAKYQRLLKNVERPSWRTDFIDVTPTKYYKSKKSSWIEAEDFLEGGEGVGFHKIVQGNISKTYRNEGVDIYKQGLAYVVGNTKPGEWLKYEFEIGEIGEYTLELKTANNFGANELIPKAKIYIDNVLIVDNYEIPNNGSWTEHVVSQVGNFEVKSGKHTLMVEINNNGFSFDAWRFYKGEIDESDPNYDEGIIVPEKENITLNFEDLQGHWAEKVVKNMVEKRLIFGISNDKFAPDEDVNLYQSIWLAFRAVKMEYDDEGWKKMAVRGGMLTSSEQSDGVVTREQFVDILMKSYMMKKGTYSLTVGKPAFSDVGDVTERYLNAVLGASELSLIQGDQEKRFNPKSNLTRAEAAVIIDRLSELF